MFYSHCVLMITSANIICKFFRCLSCTERCTQCITDHFHCCNWPLDSRLGEWYLPNGALVQGATSITAFYRNRGANGEVTLNRPSGVESPTGRFCCEVLDATHINQTLCVNTGIIHNYFLCQCCIQTFSFCR